VSQFVVYMKCRVTKAITCENCTEQQARESPFEFATDEQETDQLDWEVTRVEAA
jgi:hypothetical protein